MIDTQLTQAIEDICKKAKGASSILSCLPDSKKKQALSAMENHIRLHSKELLATNQQEVILAKMKKVSSAYIDRMTLSESGIEHIIESFNQIALLPDPVGTSIDSWRVKSGLNVSRVSIPIGVIAIIYEARPNVTADAAALCIKSGNVAILRGGSECAQTNAMIVECLQRGLLDVGLPAHLIQYLPTQDRVAIDVLLKMDRYVDVIIPRGGKSLIKHIRNHSRIPVFSHLEGLCHTYIHKDAELNMALDIVLNAKMRRVGICGATETLLIDKHIANKFLPAVIDGLVCHGCEVRGDALACDIDRRVIRATEDDWSMEYLAAIISIKVVDDIDAAIVHIEKYSTSHTEAIVTNNDKAAQLFQQAVNSAIVMHNCSTQFADGGEFGMGAEMGIATGKLHARGPVGIKQLTTYKYIVKGSGQVRA